MPKPPLRVVGPQDKPARTRKPTTRFKSLTTALKDGSRRDVLAASAVRLTRLIDNPKTEPKDVSPLMRRLTEVMRDIEAIDAAAAAETSQAKKRTRADERWDSDAI
jgi:hypothetical protein